jgi:hypothetical protein
MSLDHLSRRERLEQFAADWRGLGRMGGRVLGVGAAKPNVVWNCCAGLRDRLKSAAKGLFEGSDAVPTSSSP